MAKQQNVSIFSSPDRAIGSTKSIFNRVKTITQGYVQGSIASTADRKQAVKVLNYSIKKLDEIEKGLGKEIRGTSMLSETIEDGNILEVLANNLAITKMSANLTACAIANELEEDGDMDLEDALTLPPDGEGEEVAEGDIDKVVADDESNADKVADESGTDEAVAGEEEEVVADGNADKVVADDDDNADKDYGDGEEGENSGVEEVVAGEGVEVSETSHSLVSKISANDIRVALFGK
jgi:hypothetical protein